MGRFLKKRYFGRYPFWNALVSKALFWTLRRREQKLRKKARGRAETHIQHRNDEGRSEEAQKLLEEGYERINLGGGKKELEGFFNIDFVPHKLQTPEIVANIQDLSFIPDQSLKQVHSNQLVEHLSQKGFEEQLEAWRRILRSDGFISIRCPNVLGASYGFFFGHVPEDDREAFLEQGFPPDEDFQDPEDDWYVGDLYGLFHWFNAYPGLTENQHLNRFTPTLMRETLEKKGFRILKMSRPEAAQLVVIAEPEQEA
ncbi:MAG: hypothetical protein ABEH38_06665 [Flavobacteriales bacterium]